MNEQDLLRVAETLREWGIDKAKYILSDGADEEIILLDGERYKTLDVDSLTLALMGALPGRKVWVISERDGWEKQPARDVHIDPHVSDDSSEVSALPAEKTLWSLTIKYPDGRTYYVAVPATSRESAIDYAGELLDYQERIGLKEYLSRITDASLAVELQVADTTLQAGEDDYGTLTLIKDGETTKTNRVRLFGCWDYGMGALWAVLDAPSVAAARSVYPEIKFFERLPWRLSRDVRRYIKRLPICRLEDGPDETLQAIIAHRKQS